MVCPAIGDAANSMELVSFSSAELGTDLLVSDATFFLVAQSLSEAEADMSGTADTLFHSKKLSMKFFDRHSSHSLA
jgi:hypothetical protein